MPKGGIEGIRFGLNGIRMYPDGTGPRPADAHFPLDNDPFARAADTEASRGYDPGNVGSRTGMRRPQ